MTAATTTPTTTTDEGPQQPEAIDNERGPTPTAAIPEASMSQIPFVGIPIMSAIAFYAMMQRLSHAEA